MNIIKLPLFISLIFSFSAHAEVKLPAEYMGIWKAVSNACIADSTLAISDSTLIWQTDVDTNTYQYFDNSDVFPAFYYYDEPTPNMRHTLKILTGRDILPERENFISFTVYNDLSPYSGYAKDQPLLSVWWHDYQDDKAYFAAKASKETGGSWCLYTR